MSAAQWRTAAMIVLITCVACRRGRAQEALRITAPEAVALNVGDTTTLHATVSGSSRDAPAAVTFGAPVSSVTLRNVEAAILFK